jgi:mono/diheme cytochrome c family protein
MLRMGSRFRMTLTFAALAIAQAWRPAEAATVNYDRDIRPILSENCFQCHGQDSKKRMAGLRLDSFDGAAADRKGHAALVPGNPHASSIYQRITSENKAARMPPAYSNHNLTTEQIAMLKRWIEEGGTYNKHWAFVPPVRPAVPQVADSRWVKQPIDAFVLQRLQVEGLKPSPAATPGAWLRRVSLDLTGLPPSPAEIDAFSKDAQDRGERAYEAAVDRLLASSAYGERMAMDWLDVARYADTHGFNNDAERSMWRWRDWVIDSFNNNKPYDRFLTEQLAGDLLPNATLEQRIATGFGRNHVINSEGGIIEEEYRVEYVTDRVRTLGMAWMGLTLECAHCHDHKFDPITQRDHYRFFAFFNNIAELGEDGRVANAVPFMSAPTAEQQKKIQALELAIAKVSQRVKTREKFWNWDGHALPTLPTGAQSVCDASSSCVVGSMAANKISISKAEPFTFTAWLNPAESDRDVALLSALDYSQNMAAASYGSGIEFRLTGGELEFRFSQRYPAYSLRIRSNGAAISAGHWRNVTLVYEAGAAAQSGVAPSAGVRIFADGHELPTVVLNDDLPVPDSKPGKPISFRIGWDNNPHSARYAGQFGEIAFWNRGLSAEEMGSLFASPANDNAELRRLQSELLALKRNAPTVMVMDEMPVPRETHILVRGAYDVPGDKVEPGVPEELLGAWPVGAPKNRLGLAQWLTKPDHPLTSRVVVNRFWQQLFGTGIVKTSDNFGMQGEWPSHPELLDWLARDFVDSGWNVKALMKKIVLSATYRQDSSASPELIARDPENRLLARGPRFRLPAEVIRDQALQISGLLKPRVGGPSVYPYQPADLYKGIVVAANYPGTKYVESRGDDLYRRSLYTFWKRTVPHPTMNVFDAPDREVCIVKRNITNTPLQALTLLNDPIFVETARKLAERSIKEGGTAPQARLAFAFRLATGRAANERELATLRKSFERMLAAYQSDEPSAHSLISIGASASDPSIPASELAAYTAVANIILNLDEVITKG